MVVLNPVAPEVVVTFKAVRLLAWDVDTSCCIAAYLHKAAKTRLPKTAQSQPAHQQLPLKHNFLRQIPRQLQEQLLLIDDLGFEVRD